MAVDRLGPHRREAGGRGRPASAPRAGYAMPAQSQQAAAATLTRWRATTRAPTATGSPTCTTTGTPGSPTPTACVDAPGGARRRRTGARARRGHGTARRAAGRRRPAVTGRRLVGAMLERLAAKPGGDRTSRRSLGDMADPTARPDRRFALRVSWRTTRCSTWSSRARSSRASRGVRGAGRRRPLRDRGVRARRRAHRAHRRRGPAHRHADRVVLERHPQPARRPTLARSVHRHHRGRHPAPTLAHPLCLSPTSSTRWRPMPGSTWSIDGAGGTARCSTTTAPRTCRSTAGPSRFEAPPVGGTDPGRDRHRRPRPPRCGTSCVTSSVTSTGCIDADAIRFTSRSDRPASARRSTATPGSGPFRLTDRMEITEWRPPGDGRAPRRAGHRDRAGSP